MTKLQKDMLYLQKALGQLAIVESLLAENISLQMETEYSDLMDRKLMNLYGLRDRKPGRIDHIAPETLATIENEQTPLQDNLKEAALN